MPKPNLDEWNHWLLFFENVEEKTYIHHIIGYIEYPNPLDIDLAVTEVKNDPEFGLGDKIYELQYAILDKDEGRELAESLMEDE